MQNDHIRCESRSTFAASFVAQLLTIAYQLIHVIHPSFLHTHPHDCSLKVKWEDKFSELLVSIFCIMEWHMHMHLFLQKAHGKTHNLLNKVLQVCLK